LGDGRIMRSDWNISELKFPREYFIMQAGDPYDLNGQRSEILFPLATHKMETECPLADF
jgi:hypothetical protein